MYMYIMHIDVNARHEISATGRFTRYREDTSYVLALFVLSCGVLC